MPGISISRRHPHPITLSPPITTSPSQYHKHQLRPTTRMMSRMLTIAAVAFVSVLGGVLPAVVLAAPEAEEDASLIQPLPLRVRFVNELPNNSIELFWENHDSAPDDPNRRILEAVIPPRGGVHDCSTYVGHEFSYDFGGMRHYVNPQPGNAHGEQFLILSGDVEPRVRCEITINSQERMDYFDILVKPYWAPRGASHFLHLVRSKYYDGAVFNRVVPGFLTQFGIAKDHTTRMERREQTIWDDFPIQGMQFEPGFISFAGSGFDSRTTEIFIVDPAASEEQLRAFGENSWETPFAVVAGDVRESAVTKIYAGYGDMPPWGNGPDPSRIYDEDGYTAYLLKNFPRLDYIDRCFIIDEVVAANNLSDGEF